jgi:hypothetical protein
MDFLVVFFSAMAASAATSFFFTLLLYRLKDYLEDRKARKAFQAWKRAQDEKR